MSAFPRDHVWSRAERRRSKPTRPSTLPTRWNGAVVPMADDRIWSAAELELLTPNERHRVFNEGVVHESRPAVPRLPRERERRAGRCSKSGASSRRTVMAADRRVARVSTAFFDQLDAQLHADRGRACEPSATDFPVIDLPPIVERFATDLRRCPRSSRESPQPGCWSLLDGSFGPSPCTGSSLPTIPSTSSASNSTSRDARGFQRRKSRARVVDLRGLEPRTSCMPCRRSTRLSYRPSGTQR